jgi:hypothetical protein
MSNLGIDMNPFLLGVIVAGSMIAGGSIVRFSIKNKLVEKCIDNLAENSSTFKESNLYKEIIEKRKLNVTVNRQHNSDTELLNYDEFHSESSINDLSNNLSNNSLFDDSASLPQEINDNKITADEITVNEITVNDIIDITVNDIIVDDIIKQNEESDNKQLKLKLD